MPKHSRSQGSCAVYFAGRIALAIVLCISCVAGAQERTRPAPIRALLILGGCCHDYAAQKEILKKGIEERANVTIDTIYSEDTSTAPPLAILGNAKYADGYDVVIHDECAADVKDPKVVEGVLAPHRAGIPAVNLHCAVHSYRVAADVNKAAAPGTAEALWFDYLGVQSSGHGPQKPIAIEIKDKAHPVVAGTDGWTTIKEELYNNIVVHEATHVIARGSQEPNTRPNYTESAVAWTNEYGDKKTRVFTTTLGHNNETVADDRYLDLVARAVLWACGRLDAKGVAEDGYGPLPIASR